jgi:guanylate kinase
MVEFPSQRVKLNPSSGEISFSKNVKHKNFAKNVLKLEKFSIRLRKSEIGKDVQTENYVETRRGGEPTLFILSGPSGVGKNTVAGRWLRAVGDGRLQKIVTVTTRQPRDFEVDGVDYHFIAPEEFRRKIGRGEFLEYANVHGENYYGSPRMDVERVLSLGVDALLIIDTAGVEQILRQKNPFPIASIFIAPRSLDELKLRIMARKSETAESIARRLQTAEKEIGKIGMYDHVIISGSRDDDFSSIMEIYNNHWTRAGRRTTQ